MNVLLYSLLGILIGALLQYWFGNQRSRRDSVQSFRAQSYADMLKAMSDTVFAQRQNDKVAENTALALLTEAKARICISAPNKVVAAVANFWRIGAQLDNPVSIDAFSHMIKTMRDNTHAGGTIEQRDISQIMIGQDEITENTEQVASADKLRL